MRAIWKGAVAFGLVNVPVKLYAATGEIDVPLHQVHRTDGGRIRYRKTCGVCGETVEMSDIAKGYQTDDGELVVLTDEDLAELPLATEREIAVLEFVPSEQVDPILLAKTYYLEPEKTAAKPYALLREALAASDRMAVVKVALRQRESMAVLRVRGDVICLQTLLWPDEVRAADFPVLDAEVSVRPQELSMASSLVESLAGDFDPSEFHDAYAGALEALIEAKVSAGSTRAVPAQDAVGHGGAQGGGEVIDLLAALQRSVDKAREARGVPPREQPTQAAAAGKRAPKKPARTPATATTPAEEAPVPATPRAASRSAAANLTAPNQAKSPAVRKAASATGSTGAATPSTKPRRPTTKPAAAAASAKPAPKPRAKPAAKAPDAEPATPTRPTTRRRAS